MPTTYGLNAPTGAWCSLTETSELGKGFVFLSQCTYRCVVLPDKTCYRSIISDLRVSMHLQVRGAP